MRLQRRDQFTVYLSEPLGSLGQSEKPVVLPLSLFTIFIFGSLWTCVNLDLVKQVHWNTIPPES